MKRLASFIAAVAIVGMSGSVLAQAPTAAPETNADMARDNQGQGGKATAAERQAARKKRLAGPSSAPETNADMARDNQGQGGKATKAQREAARKKRLAGPSAQPKTNADMAKDNK